METKEKIIQEVQRLGTERLKGLDVLVDLAKERDERIEERKSLNAEIKEYNDKIGKYLTTLRALTADSKALQKQLDDF